MKLWKQLMLVLAVFLLSSSLYAEKRNDFVKENNYGFTYEDHAAILNFISPIQKSWGKLVAVEKINNSTERWTFDSDAQVTIVFLSIKENILAGHSLFQISKIWKVKKLEK